MLLSILIRNRNEAENLAVTLASVRRQHCDFDYEVVVVDNDSDDDSVAVAHKYGARVLPLQRDAFTFGHALNVGMAQCSGDFILILSAHIILMQDNFLQQLPGYFSNPDVAGLRFIQSNDVPLVKAAMVSGPQQLVYSNEQGFATAHWKHLLVNHCAAVRRSCWQLQPYDEQLIASEDKRWSLDMLQRGFTLLYQVPCFYLYTKQATRQGKVNRMAIETVTRKKISGDTNPIPGSAWKAYGAVLRTTVKRLYAELRVQQQYRLLVKKILQR